MKFLEMTPAVEALDFEFQVHWHVLSLPTSSLVRSVWLNCSGKELTSVPPPLIWIQPRSCLGALHVHFPLPGHPSPGHASSCIPAICSCVSFSPSSPCWAQSCLTLWDLMDCSPPGSSVHGISQARILEWVAVSFSRGSRIESVSPSLAGRFLTTEPPRKPNYFFSNHLFRDFPTALSLPCLVLLHSTISYWYFTWLFD